LADAQERAANPGNMERDVRWHDGLQLDRVQMLRVRWDLPALCDGGKKKAYVPYRTERTNDGG